MFYRFKIETEKNNKEDNSLIINHDVKLKLSLQKTRENCSIYKVVFIIYIVSFVACFRLKAADENHIARFLLTFARKEIQKRTLNCNWRKPK